MSLGIKRMTKYICTLILLCGMLVAAVNAQDASSSLTGLVTDPSGAAVPGARVVAAPSSGQPVNARTNANGMYEFKTLLAGTYTLRIFAKGFQPFVQEGVKIETGKPISINMQLEIATQNEKVEVQDESTQLDVTASSNASSVVLKGKDLDALSDDPDELQDELQALAGPSAGPNGGQIYIDGFTGGTLPPKSSIREIRINQNPFSAEYDHLGFGRIEVFTKPGTDKYHGQFMVNGNTAGFNARNPFQGTGPLPGYDSQFYNANFGGPAGKKASFFLDFSRRNIDELSVINTPALDENLNPIQFTDSVPNPRVRTEFSPRLDYQLTKNNTLVVRYQYEREKDENSGIGLFTLPSQASNVLDTEHQVQVTDTQILNATTINETRFRFVRSEHRLTPLDSTPTINVNGAFSGGGYNSGLTDDTEDQYELQNYTSKILGKHFLKLGGRLRATKDALSQNAGFNGNFVFGAQSVNSLTLAACDPTAGDPNCVSYTGLQIYQTVQQGIAGGMTAAQVRAATGLGPTQFTIVQGQAAAQNTYWDLGIYAQDEWKIKSNISLTYGARIETQNQIANPAKVAPRIGLAWGIDPGQKGQPKTVLRAGWGIFYDRFGQNLLLQAQRLNGTTQQQFVVTNPDFYPNLPTSADLAASTSSPTIYQVDPNLKTPYTMQGGLTLERQITKAANIAVTYLNSRGLHFLITRNINAPVGPTFNPDDVAERPMGNLDNVYQYEGAGIFKQNQLIINGSLRIGTRVSLFGYYSLSYANSDNSVTSQPGFPTNQYNIAADYGRAPFDVRDRMFLGGSVSMPYQFRLSPFMIVSSGSPFNVTLGQDLNGDSIFNDRPTYSQFQTALANANLTKNVSFNCTESDPNAIIPINCAQAPARFSLNLRLSKTFGFGKKNETASNAGAGGPMQGGTFGRPGGGGRGGRGGPFGGDSSGQKYSLTFAVGVRNVFNNVNVANPVGVISSPIFGESNALAGGPFGSSSYNRRVDLQATFSF